MSGQRALAFEPPPRLDPAGRAAAYARAFPQFPGSHFHAAGRTQQALWVLGNNYRGTGYYGAYPGGLLRRLWALYPDAARAVHVCSGSLPPQTRGVRVDLRHAIPVGDGVVRPDVVGDVQALPFVDGAFDLALADIPYGARHAERYGTPMPSRRRVVAAVRRALAARGQLSWLDTKLPMYRKDQWLLWGLVVVVVSTNHDVRLLSLFERRDGETT